MRLCQQATLETRPEKERRSLAEMTADWRRRSEAHLGPRPEQLARVPSLAGPNDLPVLNPTDLGQSILADAARAAADAVVARRATFSRWNVAAEALRILHGVRFASPPERVAVAERITELTLAGTARPNPAAAEADSGKLYTTETIIDRGRGAFARCFPAQRRTSPFPPDSCPGATPARPDREDCLSLDQVLAVEQISTSGRPLDPLVGPAGTGKSTTMAALRAVWETEHGLGSVIGLAPSAAAAEALAIELGTATENTGEVAPRVAQGA